MNLVGWQFMPDYEWWGDCYGSATESKFWVYTHSTRVAFFSLPRNSVVPNGLGDPHREIDIELSQSGGTTTSDGLPALCHAAESRCWSGGKARWVNVLGSTPLGNVIDGFVNSPEFSLGIQ
jgi:hypothetical protein